MEEESHLNPLAKNHQKNDVVLSNNKPPFNLQTTKQESRITKKPVYLLLAIVLLSIAFLIFGLIVLRLHTPTLRLSNVVVNDLHYNSTTSFNMTVTATLRLHNMNFGSFKFETGSAALLHGNATIGAAAIHGGEIGGRERREMSATVEVSENHINVSGEGESGLVKLRSYAELRGEIGVMKTVRRRTAFMNCSLDLNLTSQEIQGYSCL